MSLSDRADSPITTITATIIHNSLQSTGLQLSQHNGNKGNNSIEQQQQSKNRICRDFVRGSCRRLYCKYPHVQSSDLVVFCHDFQNNKCPRINCKFLHYSIDDEDHYRKYGEFPIGQNQGNNNSGGGGCSNNVNSDVDFVNNQNLNNSGDYPGDYNDYNGFFSNSNSSNGSRLPSLLDSDLFHPCQQQQRMDGGCSLHCHNDRVSFSSGPSSSFRNSLSLKRMNGQDREFLNQAPKSKRCREDDLMTILRGFEEEHLMLKRRVEANELKIAELRASNEYLMTQNAQLRLSTVQVSRVVNPVTVTNTQSQSSAAPQVINASMAPVQVATPIVSMSAQSAPVVAHAAPIAIHATTNTSQPTQHILGTSQITLAPALSAPSIGLSINTSQALQAAISNATQPIISYPIMTHSILPH